ncbi:esterase/lipase family protein [Bythopirellula goksoeyrii]|uniref:esterase/lipase family protein n=1 Tax=Bythopirellula goksoeyrii TaxID=1400387 RepID=UPI0011CDECE8|nr:alpha/beta fold hydrolase [Bythopirellula goksoeyrii]
MQEKPAIQPATIRQPPGQCRSSFVLLLLFCLVTGCATSTNKWVALRSTPRNPLTESLGLLTKQGPKPTERTLQLLRRYNLHEDLEGDRRELLVKLGEIEKRSPNRENVYAQAELAYVVGKRAERGSHSEKALEYYGAAVLHSYSYLFDEKYATVSNPYDPEFRRACDLYNAALEGTLRIVQEQNSLQPGTTQHIKTANHDCRLEVRLQSNDWHADDIDHFEFVTDYEVHGLRNHYHNFGLGVPLIAVRRKHEGEDPREEYYPEDLSFPVTAFLRVNLAAANESTVQTAVLELFDPLNQPMVQVASHNVPLETDLSTPLAHTLSQPALDDTRLSTLGLLKPEKVKQVQGLYMLEPFQEDKIPVLMVHGLWSSPVTWMEMFNDLRSDPQIRKHYQFWFYLYPTGQPFWFSAAQMREDLADMRQKVDPEGRFPALDQTILVGHSMGGLVSKLQTVDSGNDFWSTLSEHPFSELQADEELREGLAQTFFFDPNPSIRRVITIGTPHRGSEFANDTTRWLGRKLIRIPTKLMQGKHQLIARNPGFFRKDAPLDINTSIDSLEPKSPLLPVLLTAHCSSWVKYNNIMGELPAEGIASWFSSGKGDGVVTLESARLENAESQIVVPADHSLVHRHPQSILEVRRILLQQVAEIRNYTYGDQINQVSIPQQSIREARIQSELPLPTSTSNIDSEIAQEATPILAK